MHNEPPQSITGRQTPNRSKVETPLWTSDSSVSHPTPQPTIASFTQNDESAVAGLLALGTSTNDILGADLGQSDFAVSPPAGRAGHLSQAMSSSKYANSPSVVSPSQISHTSQPNTEVSPTDTLELLRYYRYEIAPWVRVLLRSEERCESDAFSWIFAITDSCSALRGCSWRWSLNQFGHLSWPSRRHQPICYVRDLHRRASIKGLDTLWQRLRWTSQHLRFYAYWMRHAIA